MPGRQPVSLAWPGGGGGGGGGGILDTYVCIYCTYCGFFNANLIICINSSQCKQCWLRLECTYTCAQCSLTVHYCMYRELVVVVAKYCFCTHPKWRGSHCLVQVHRTLVLLAMGSVYLIWLVGVLSISSLLCV